MNLYVKRVDYKRDLNGTTVTADFDTDPAFEAIEVNHIIAMELIQSLADAANIDVEILGPRQP